jgi:hypothetical protein
MDDIEGERLALERMRAIEPVGPTYPCPQCKGELRYAQDHPERGTGAIVIILGIILAPVCLGIPILIYGLIMIGRVKAYWHCRSCGRTFPA